MSKPVTKLKITSSKFLTLGVGLALMGYTTLSPAQSTHHHKHHHHHGYHDVAFDPNHLVLFSTTALVVDSENHQVLYSKNPDPVHPIASITKLMTALVVLDQHQNMDEELITQEDDKDMIRFSHSHLRVGAKTTRMNFLKMALIASENRAANALGRNYPGGTVAFVQKMNEKAKALGLKHTHFSDPAGLNTENVSTAEDLALLVNIADQQPIISDITTTKSVQIPVGYRGGLVQFNNTNPLVANKSWDIGVSKTGFINESGQCLVMQTEVAGRSVVMVLLDSHGRHSRVVDAIHMKRWLETHPSPLPPAVNPVPSDASHLTVS